MNSTSTKNNNASRRRRRGRTIYAALVLVMCMSAAAFMGYLAYEELNERGAGDGYYQSLAGQMSNTQEPSGTAAAEETAVPKTGESEESAEKAGTRINFEALWESCPDVVGWITIEGTPVNYPIVQGEDNDFYLTHLPDGTKNEAGSIMMDAACDAEFGSEITILHGHNMRGGAMFGSLDLYSNEGYYEEHPVMELCTPEGDYEVQIVAGWLVGAETFEYPTGFLTDEEFSRFMKKAKMQSVFDADAEAARGDRLLMLSTCAYVFEDARFVLLGRIVENGG